MHPSCGLGWCWWSGGPPIGSQLLAGDPAALSGLRGGRGGEPGVAGVPVAPAGIGSLAEAPADDPAKATVQDAVDVLNAARSEPTQTAILAAYASWAAWLGGHELGQEHLDATVGLVADGADLLDWLAGGVVQLPVEVALARVDGAGIAAAHGDDRVGAKG